MAYLDKETVIIIPKSIINQMIEQAKAEFPNEGCGILAGQGNKVSHIYKMVNSEKSAESFFMDPKEQFSVIKKMRQDNLEMLAIYHSHPSTPARPSAKDIEMALYPQASYLIISLEKRNEPLIRAFQIKEGKVEEEKIEIEGE